MSITRVLAKLQGTDNEVATTRALTVLSASIFDRTITLRLGSNIDANESLVLYLYDSTQDNARNFPLIASARLNEKRDSYVAELQVGKQKETRTYARTTTRLKAKKGESQGELNLRTDILELIDHILKDLNVVKSSSRATTNAKVSALEAEIERLKAELASKTTRASRVKKVNA